MMALLPALASMASQPPAWKAQNAQVDPSQNGSQQQQMGPPPDNQQGGSQVLSMLAKMGQQPQQGQPQSTPAVSQSAVQGDGNSSGFGQILMQLLGQGAGK